VFVRMVAALRRGQPWGDRLHAVTQRIAVRARGQAVARRQREKHLKPMKSAKPLDELTRRKLRRVLDEEIAALAEHHCTPIVLCYFESKSYEQAANELGWAKSSLASRLARAWELLRGQLARRRHGIDVLECG
jgi:DNA-directed RNA polymerase specialized sigma24 family protein